MSREVLVEAKRLIETGGWIQGSFNRGESYCVVGACGEAERRLGYPGPSYDINPVLKMMRRAVGLNDRDSLMPWNDAPGRTQAEVLAAFDKAIEACE